MLSILTAILIILSVVEIPKELGFVTFVVALGVPVYYLCVRLQKPSKLFRCIGKLYWSDTFFILQWFYFTKCYQNAHREWMWNTCWKKNWRDENKSSPTQKDFMWRFWKLVMIMALSLSPLSYLPWSSRKKNWWGISVERNWEGVTQ